MKIGAAISPYQHFGLCNCDLPDEPGARHIEYFEEDVKRAKAIGLDAFRTGVEWALIEPREEVLDRRWLGFFERYLATIREEGLELWLTAHHFTNPKWVWKIGGWESRDTAKRFLRYIELILQNFYKYINYLIIFNEPEIYVYLAYLKGDLPPHGYLAYRHAGRALENILNVIQAARDVSKSYGVKATFTHPYRKYVGRGPAKLLAYALSKLAPSSLEVAKEMDVLAINFYVVTEVKLGDFRNLLKPEALLALRRHKIAITEYGVATRNEALREAYLCRMAQVFEELRPEAAIWWSLLHGYEWGLGYSPFFALFDEARRPTPLALKMRRIIENPPRACGELPEDLGLEWRAAL
ncbi:MAG: family 1 glycosylhydrolase [Thermoproteus sp. AZ2]|jgi:beta-glucosidase|uniref:Family 1 glycosylhydrolase n=1 Tax=Thermoproteus sp. AZ2 TaxID=1609232 RepID=A0ACC6UZP8_9CREN|nr:MAG: beta-glucosidase [Thermoproteus sp. AZ2]